jgi:hypothetical protein
MENIYFHFCLQAQPMNVPTSFKQRAMLVDEIWHAVGDGASDIDWYLKRTVLGGIYSTTEIYMLTDSSTGLCSLLCSQNSDYNCEPSISLLCSMRPTPPPPPPTTKKKNFFHELFFGMNPS